jgi:outer membrane receptor protein involved in Fe transport
LQVPGVYHLTVNAAGRYERYPRIDSVATPKVGLIYAPLPDLDLKASWGTSFKAPTLDQLFTYKAVSLNSASDFQATGYPARSTVLQISGGNPDGLRPERARTWTATVALHPRMLPKAQLEVSYFHVAYRDRVISPLQSSRGALTNPIYSNIVTLNPTQAQIDAAIAGAPGGVTNETSDPYDPANVVAIIDNRQRNSARETAHGVDISARYQIDSGHLGQFVLDASASYLNSNQLLVAGLPSRELAGIIFNPPHWRARAGIDWNRGGTSASIHLNRIGGETDNRQEPSIAIRGMNTVDLAVGTTIGSTGGVLSGLSISVSVINLFNEKPPTISPEFEIDPTYDSTNTSPVGRFVGLTVGKRW